MYREGAETVLFYYALFGDTQNLSGHLAIDAGFAIGCVVLLLAWLVMRYSVVRLPLKPFFMVTGSFMYLMAFVFAGKGVLELVEGKLFQPTLINGIPEIGWLAFTPIAKPCCRRRSGCLWRWWRWWRCGLCSAAVRWPTKQYTLIRSSFLTRGNVR